MGKNITIEKEIKIRNVKKVWGNIKAQKTPLDLNLKEVEVVDGAGLQLIIFLLNLSKKFPPKYKIIGISEKLKSLLGSTGYIIGKGEINE